MMKRNVGKLDRLVRMALSILLIVLVLSNYLLGASAYIAVAAAIILFVTSLFGTCPIYSLLNLSTVQKKP